MRELYFKVGMFVLQYESWIIGPILGIFTAGMLHEVIIPMVNRLF